MQPLVALVLHNLPSLYPPSFRINDFFILIFGCAECTIKTMVVLGAKNICAMDVGEVGVATL